MSTYRKMLENGEGDVLVKHNKWPFWGNLHHFEKSVAGLACAAIAVGAAVLIRMTLP